MKKLESTLPNMAVVLMLVAVVSGGILALVNDITKDPIEKQNKLILSNGIKAVLCSDDLTVSSTDSIIKDIAGKENIFIIHKATDKNGKFIGAAVESSTMGFGGAFKILVGFDAESKILGYTVLEHAETPGLGAKADKWFQKDGKGCIVGRTMQAGSPLTVKKDGGEIDAITASTITSRAFLEAVNKAYDAYSQQNTDATSGATTLSKQ